MQLTLRNALIVSAAIHTAAIAPLCATSPLKEPAKKDMVVDYVVIEEPFKTKMPVTDVGLKVPETPKVELKPKVEAAPAPKAPTAKVEANKDAVRDLAQKQAQAKTTKDYINYYQLLREKIRQKVKRGYRNAYGEGEIHLNFILKANGSLVSCDIDKAASSSDAKLGELAVSSVRQASPFPPFPKVLAVPTMNFSVTVVFNKERS